ncbi:MAG TPA: hypothetical protein VMD58_12050 [Acidobacteriaceae bacterium]|nr:hypothetical protein [Acidobacteriaceae bacterium]
MKNRSLIGFWLGPVLLVTFASLLTSCGQNYYFAGRSLPPSGVLNRVLVAVQNPSALSKGALYFDDAYYDIRHAHSASSGQFSIAGYSGSLPLTIQNMPEEQVGAVYGAGDGSFVIANYTEEKTGTPIVIPGGLSSSIFIDRPRDFVYATNGTTHVVSVVDLSTSKSYELNLPNAYRVSINPGGTIALVFVQNATQGQNTTIGSTPSDEFAVYSIVGLTANQQLAAAASNDPQHYLNAQDCEPQNLPAFCAFPVSTGPNASFDHPAKAVFSPDGSAAYVLDCGPECGGTTAGVTVIPITASELNTNTSGGKGIALVAQSNIKVAGGATDAIFNGNTLYLAGQQLQSDGLFEGYLSTLNTQTGQVTGVYPISDGTHNKMVFGDDNTLWIGSSNCLEGETYKKAQASGGSVPYGCLTMFNTSTNKPTLDAYKGDATGIAAVTGLDKVYTAEGGQVYIYATANFNELDNSNVTVTGTASDVAYMDAGSDADNTNY